jgi:hypothetical protein
MKKIALLAIAGCTAIPVLAADVGVSIGINQPGVYGRVDIGNAGPPPVVYTQPVLVSPPAYVVDQQPVYMYVPVEQQRHWRRYCSTYGACGRPVYFVREQWVRAGGRRDHYQLVGGRGRGHDRDWLDRGQDRGLDRGPARDWHDRR